jgi:hypothetical protein
MKYVLIFVLVVTFDPHAGAQQPQPPPEQQQAQPGAQQPPQPAPGAASQAPPTEKSEAAQGAQATPAVVASEAVRLEPVQVTQLLHKVFSAAYRVSDLLTLLQPEKWNMDEAARKSFDQTLESLRSQLKQLEEWRRQFEAQPQNLVLGNATDAAIGSVYLDADTLARAVSQYENPASAAQFKQAAEQFLGLQRTLKGYLDSLRVPAQAAPTAAQPSQPAGNQPAAPQTEQVAAPQAAPPPSTSTALAGSITPEQVKTLMQQVYVATFRLGDLMTLVHPERWKVPEPVRDSFKQDLVTLRDHLRALEASRSQFAEQTDSPYLGYEVYVSIPPVVSSLGRIAQNVAQFENQGLASQVGQPGKWLRDAGQTLESYLDTMLSRHQQVVRSYQTDLVACQNTLNYAMRSQAAQPMQPIKFARPLQSIRITRRKAAEAARAAAQGKAGDANSKR